MRNRSTASQNKLDLSFMLVRRWDSSNIYCSCNDFIMKTRKRLWNPTIIRKTMLETKILIVNDTTYSFLRHFAERLITFSNHPWFVVCPRLSFIGAFKLFFFIKCHKKLCCGNNLSNTSNMKNRALSCGGTKKLPELIFTKEQ